MKKMKKILLIVTLLIISCVSLMLMFVNTTIYNFLCNILTCESNIILPSIIFGTSSFFTINYIFYLKKRKSLLPSLLIVITNIIIYSILPSTSDYFLPTKEDGLAYFNLILPALYILIITSKKFLRNNKHKREQIK